MIPYDFKPILGGHSSKQFSPETFRNMYISVAEANGRIGVHDFPGLKTVGNNGDGTGGGRGLLFDNDNTLFIICGNTLYKETSGGARTDLGGLSGSLGSNPTVGSTDQAIMAYDGSTLGIAANGKLYKYTGSGSVSEISQSVVTNPRTIDLINNQWIIAGDNQTFAVSDAGDIDTWNALNYAAETSVGDPLLRAYVFNDLVYMFGSASIVPWANTGVGNPPFARQNTALINVGVVGRHAITNTDQYMYWLGDDRRVYQAIGASWRAVNTSGVSHLIEAVADVTDVVASTFIIEGQVFVMFNFRSGGFSLVYSETNQYWFQLSSGTDKYTPARYYATEFVYAFNKWYGLDYRTGESVYLDLDTFTDNGDARLRIATLPPITGLMTGKPQNMVTFTGMHIPMQTGVGINTGQGVSPEIMCELSNDGGETWGKETKVNIGAMGAYMKKIMFYDFATGYEVVPRIMCSDPVRLSFYSGGTVDVVDAGY